MLFSKKHPQFRKPRTVPPMRPLGFQLFLGFSKEGQIVPNMSKHGAKQTLETVPTSKPKNCTTKRWTDVRTARLRTDWSARGRELKLLDKIKQSVL